MPSHPRLHFFRRSLASCPFHWPMQSIPGVNNANQWGSYEQIDKKCPDLHQSEHADLRVAVVVSLVVRACYQQATARGPKKMSSDHETRGEAQRILLEVSEEPGGSTRWRSVLLCEFTRSPFGRAGRADLLLRCHWAVTGRHQRRRAAREARRPCGSGAGMACSSSREIRPVGHRKPMPSAAVRWKEASNSRSSASERVLLSSSQ